MRPTGVLIENHFDVDQDDNVETAAIFMETDIPGGVFFCPPTAGSRLGVNVHVEDAKSFQSASSKEERDEIVGKYVAKKPNSDQYALAYGGFIGNIAVRVVLEVNNIQHKTKK